MDTGPVNHAVNVNYSINDRTYDQTVRTRSSNAVSDIIFWNLYNDPTNIPKPNFATLSASQVTGVNLSSVGVADTMSILNKRVQFTVGVRRQTAGSEVTNALTPALSRRNTRTTLYCTSGPKGNGDGTNGTRLETKGPLPRPGPAAGRPTRPGA